MNTDLGSGASGQSERGDWITPFADQRLLTMTATDEDLRAALVDANIPTLLMVLAVFTGDRCWLEDPYRPTRTVALDDNDSGGLSEVARDEVRAAAFDVLREWRDKERPLPAPPAAGELIELLQASLGEAVPPEYATTMAEEAGLVRRETVSWTAGRPAAAEAMNVVIVGAGLAGVATAITLRSLGIGFIVLERRAAAGGVWHDNRYPGAGVDTPTHLYSYSFAPKRDWSRYYAKQPEILGYIQRTARDAGIEGCVRFGREVVEARWNDETHVWQVEARCPDGSIERLTANVVISCVGILNRPSVPNLPGQDSFAGPLFHSSQWEPTLDVTGKRVAVIGTGATSMQIVPAIADSAEQVLVFQRSPQWVAPNANYLRDVSDGTRLMMAQVPYYASFYRARLIWMFQDKLLPTLRRDPDWPHQDRSVNAKNDKHRKFFTKYLDDALGDRTDLRDKVLPTYPPYGKRILMDNNWISTIKRADVELVSSAVTAFDEEHVITDEGAYSADVVVLATGFHSSRMLWPIDIRGRGGASLRDQWGEEDASAYLGITVPNFPNLFLVGGPHTALGHGGSSIYVAECAIAYIAQLVMRMVEEGIASIEVRAEVSTAYNERVDAEHEQLIWTHPDAQSWYRNAKGRVLANTPWRGVDYWAMTREPDLGDFVTTAAVHSAEQAPIDHRRLPPQV